MPESIKTARYEDRPSSKLSIGDYFTQHVVWVLLPFIGFAAGLGLRKLTKLPILEQPQNATNIFRKAEVKAAERAMANESNHYVMRNGEFWGLGAGGAVGTYRLWRANTKQQLEVDQVAKDVEKLRDMESTNSHLEKENGRLRQQIKFTERHTARTGATHADRALGSKGESTEIARH